MKLFVNVLLVVFLNGATFYVNNTSEFQTALITAQTNGEHDTITVAAGTFTVSSTLTYNASENFSLIIAGTGMGSTILDGGESVQMLYLLSTGLNANICIENISFENGYTSSDGGALHMEVNAAEIRLLNSEFNDNFAANLAGGATVLSNTGDITVSGCFFRRNVGYYNAGGLNAGTGSGLVTLANSVFEHDTVRDLIDSVSHAGGDAGGALLYAEEGHIIMNGNTFTGNFSPDGGGGGFVYPLGTGVSATIENNTFQGNHAQLDGGGCFARINGSGILEYHNNEHIGNTTGTADGAGAMLYVNEGSLFCSGNTYNGNTSAADGGGTWIWLGLGIMDVQWNIFVGNEAANNGGGASIVIDNGSCALYRNLVYSNTAGNVGAGLSYATTGAGLLLFHNTTYGNSASDGGGVYFYFDQSSATTTVVNNILWNDVPNGLAMSGAVSVIATYSDIENGTGEPWFGTGCIDADPLFANPGAGNFNLTWQNFPVSDSTKSPCIDAGDPARPQDPDSTAADMGVFYFDQATGISERHTGVYTSRLFLNNANPLSSTTPVYFSLSHASQVAITLYDQTGRQIETLLSANVTAGVHSLIWTVENIQPGVYFLRMATDHGTATQKVVIVK